LDLGSPGAAAARANLGLGCLAGANLGPPGRPPPCDCWARPAWQAAPWAVAAGEGNPGLGMAAVGLVGCTRPAGVPCPGAETSCSEGSRSWALEAGVAAAEAGARIGTLSHCSKMIARCKIYV